MHVVRHETTLDTRFPTHCPSAPVSSQFYSAFFYCLIELNLPLASLLAPLRNALNLIGSHASKKGLKDCEMAFEAGGPTTKLALSLAGNLDAYGYPSLHDGHHCHRRLNLCGA